MKANGQDKPKPQGQLSVDPLNSPIKGERMLTLLNIYRGSGPRTDPALRLTFGPQLKLAVDNKPAKKSEHNSPPPRAA